MKLSLYVVTSLPRTGTTTLCRMARMCGKKPIHVLGDKDLQRELDSGCNFFADTPFYSPEYLSCLIEVLQPLYDIKFIYSHREKEKWLSSFNSLLKRWRAPTRPHCHKKNALYDMICYRSLIKDPRVHYEIIKNIASIYSIEILDYSFDKGWKPFCDFLNVHVPPCDLPWLNKTK